MFELASLNLGRHRSLVKFAAFLKPYGNLLVLAVVFTVLLGSIEPILASRMALLIDEAFIAQNEEALLLFPLQIVALFVAKGMLEYLSVVTRSEVSTRSLADIRRKLFACYLSMSYQYHREHDPGTLISVMTYDLNQARALLGDFWLDLLKNIVMAIGLLGYLCFISLDLTILIFFSLPFIGLLAAIVGKRIKLNAKVMQAANRGLLSNIQEAFLAVTDVKIFGDVFHIKKFGNINELFVETQHRSIIWQSLVVPLVQILGAILLGGIVFLGARYVVNGEISPGQLVAYITAVGLIFDPIRRLSTMYASLQRALVGVDSVMKYFEFEGFDSVADGTHGCRPSIFERNLKSPALKLTNTSINRQGRVVIQNLNMLTSYPGGFLITGASGSGKSTILDLITGFVEQSTGEVEFFQRKNDELSVSEVHRLISVVPQSQYFLNTSLRQVLVPDSRIISDQRIFDALSSVGAAEFVLNLAGILDFRVGPGGTSLSGGQRQRIAIARAMLKDAPIMVLDEPTSALDLSAAKKVWTGLNELSKTRTVIIVTHAPPNFGDFNHILDLDQRV